MVNVIIKSSLPFFTFYGKENEFGIGPGENEYPEDKFAELEKCGKWQARQKSKAAHDVILPESTEEKKAKK